jgi:hypothetical protein
MLNNNELHLLANWLGIKNRGVRPEQRVYILPIGEFGTVIKIRQDERGEPLIDVQRDSDGVSHVCRECELN